MKFLLAQQRLLLEMHFIFKLLNEVKLILITVDYYKGLSPRFPMYRSRKPHAIINH